MPHGHMSHVPLKRYEGGESPELPISNTFLPIKIMHFVLAKYKLSKAIPGQTRTDPGG